MINTHPAPVFFFAPAGRPRPAVYTSARRLRCWKKGRRTCRSGQTEENNALVFSHSKATGLNLNCPRVPDTYTISEQQAIDTGQTPQGCRRWPVTVCRVFRS